MIKKGDTFWAVSTTTIGCIAPLKNVVTTDIELPENEKAEGASRSLMDALQCPQKSTVKAKVVLVLFMSVHMIFNGRPVLKDYCTVYLKICNLIIYMHLLFSS